MKRMHDRLTDMFGGVWKKHPTMKRWFSNDHNFSVYQSSKTLRIGVCDMVYRRSDTLDVVYYPKEAKGKQ